MKINLKESIDKLDRQTFCKDDLLNMYYCCNFNDNDKAILVEMFSKDNTRGVTRFIKEAYKKKYDGVQMICNPSPAAFNASMGESVVDTYGGAFDIDEDQYFTREDLDEFLDYVTEEIEKSLDINDVIEVYDADIDDNILSITLSFEGYEKQYRTRIDMRRIRVPSDLVRRYADECIEYFVSKFQEAIDNEDVILDESGALAALAGTAVASAASGFGSAVGNRIMDEILPEDVNDL